RPSHHHRAASPRTQGQTPRLTIQRDLGEDHAQKLFVTAAGAAAMSVPLAGAAWADQPADPGLGNQGLRALQLLYQMINGFAAPLRSALRTVLASRVASGPQRGGTQRRPRRRPGFRGNNPQAN